MTFLPEGATAMARGTKARRHGGVKNCTDSRLMFRKGNGRATPLPLPAGGDGAGQEGAVYPCRAAARFDQPDRHDGAVGRRTPESTIHDGRLPAGGVTVRIVAPVRPAPKAGRTAVGDRRGDVAHCARPGDKRRSFSASLLQVGQREPVVSESGRGEKGAFSTPRKAEHRRGITLARGVDLSMAGLNPGAAKPTMI
jgi:hypothetical protein